MNTAHLELLNHIPSIVFVVNICQSWKTQHCKYIAIIALYKGTINPIHIVYLSSNSVNECFQRREVLQGRIQQPRPKTFSLDCDSTSYMNAIRGRWYPRVLLNSCSRYLRYAASPYHGSIRWPVCKCDVYSSTHGTMCYKLATNLFISHWFVSRISANILWNFEV